MRISLKSTTHSYYCSETNYYVGGADNYGRCDYESWEAFKEEWFMNGQFMDDDLNHLFRFDIYEESGNFQLFLYFILQRKGIFRPVIIEKITDNDLPEIEKFLAERWEYMKTQWEEFSTEVPNG